MESKRKLRVCIIGQGRSGRDIHGAFFRSEENRVATVVAIVDRDEERRLRAKEEFGCDVYADYTEILGRDDIDLVVNASLSHMHYPISKDLLEHGFHVLSEKPFGRTDWECRDLILTAKKHGRIITAFHQTLFTAAYLKCKEVVSSGKLGDAVQITLRYSSFGRRWDWQTLQSHCAGSVYNSGPHPIAQALDLLEWDPDIRLAFSALRTALTSGDAEDYGKLILTAPHRPVVDVEISCTDAYASDYVFKVQGTRGTYLSTQTEYKMKYIPDFSVYPERPVVREPLKKEDGTPSYCSETLDFTVEEGKFEGSAFTTAVATFYDLLYRALTEGAPLPLSPEKAARVIWVIEACHAQNPLPVRFD